MSAWTTLLDECRERAASNVELHGPFVAELPADDELAEQLVGIDGAAAEAIVVLGPKPAEPLLAPLARAVAAATSPAPVDVVDADIGLALLACRNDVLVAGRADLLSGEDPTAAWLNQVAASPIAEDPDFERRLWFVAAAAGEPPLLRELVDAGPVDAPVAVPENFAVTLAGAVLGGEPVEREWQAWLVSAADWLRTGDLSWPDLLWAARCVYARVGGEDVTRVADLLRAEIGG
ncbi:hypothetical protein [Solirubrobacter soli]|uniref:hypothetical protein n=1 Tax=Solirubrobacter soli TaxID=363832 RepID=UPI000406FC7F|nr:hypothetical protein [Solirubrobacter soli]